MVPQYLSTAEMVGWLFGVLFSLLKLVFVGAAWLGGLAVVAVGCCC